MTPEQFSNQLDRVDDPYLEEVNELRLRQHRKSRFTLMKTLSMAACFAILIAAGSITMLRFRNTPKTEEAIVCYTTDGDESTASDAADSAESNAVNSMEAGAEAKSESTAFGTGAKTDGTASGGTAKSESTAIAESANVAESADITESADTVQERTLVVQIKRVSISDKTLVGEVLIPDAEGTFSEKEEIEIAWDTADPEGIETWTVGSKVTVSYTAYEAGTVLTADRICAYDESRDGE